MARVTRTTSRGAWRKKGRRARYYRYAGSFMARGGIYGRSRCYPYVGGRISRIFRTCIHFSFCESNFRRQTANRRAYNSHEMYPLFAYQIRPGPWTPVPGGGGEYRIGGDAVAGGVLMFDFRITLRIAA